MMNANRSNDRQTIEKLKLVLRIILVALKLAQIFHVIYCLLTGA